MKQLCIQRGTFAGESAIRIVFNNKEPRRPLGQMKEFLSQAIHAGHLTLTSRWWLSCKPRNRVRVASSSCRAATACDRRCGRSAATGVCRRTLSSEPREYYVVAPIRAKPYMGQAIPQWTSMLDRLISRNSQKSDTTSDTLIVTCAIRIVIAILVFLELHIRR